VIYIYRPKHSAGGEELAYALTAAGIGARFIRKERELQLEDRLICWGWAYPGVLPGIHVLNNVAPPSKLNEARLLQQAGVPTVEVVSDNRRPPAVPIDRGTFELPGPVVSELGARLLINDLELWLQAPLPPQVEWLPRANDHCNGDDLLFEGWADGGVADFYVKKETLAREIRIHSFLGKSILAGVKVPKRGVEAHPWIRSTNAGWTIQYGGFRSTPEQRALAHAAVAACGLQFGAVDIGIRPDDSMLVLEVNRAPGLDGTVELAPYIKAIQGWVSTYSEAAA
jgi:hypothetical protein